jgi:hypothetical protein
MTPPTDQFLLRLQYVCLFLVQTVFIMAGLHKGPVKEVLYLSLTWLVLAVVVTAVMHAFSQNKYGVSLWVLLTARECPRPIQDQKDSV